MDTTVPVVFAPDGDIPMPYMQRTRDDYLALGYNNPYRWVHFATVQSPLQWSEDASWKSDFSNVAQLSTTEVPQPPQQFDKQKVIAYSKRDGA
jgi:hypothetical protein